MFLQFNAKVAESPASGAGRRSRRVGFGAMVLVSMFVAGCSADAYQLVDRPSREIALKDSAAPTDTATPQPISDIAPPEGFVATAPDTVLEFGTPAHVVTTTNDAEYQYWSVTVWPGNVRFVEDVVLSSSIEGIDHFECYPTDITYLGSSVRREATEFKRFAPPNRKNSVVAAPEFFPVDDSGEAANSVVNADADVCGVPPEGQLPPMSAILRPGEVYRSAVGSYYYSDRKKGINPAGVAVALLHEGGENPPPGYVYWF